MILDKFFGAQMSTPVTTMAQTPSEVGIASEHLAQSAPAVLRAETPEAPAKDAASAHMADRSIGGAAMTADGAQALDGAGRKACTVMKVVSAVILAVAVAPGGDGEDSDIDAATHSLLSRAMELADAALPILGGRAAGEAGADMRNQLRQYAADTVSLQWRLAHSTGYKDLSVEQIMRIYRQVDSSSFIAEVNGTTSADGGASADVVAARRLALLSVTTEIHNAVGNFDYFHPDPAQLVEAGVREVIRVADEALPQLMPTGSHDENTRSTFKRIFLERAGTLYAQNYRAMARKDVKRIAEMDDQERLRFMHENKVSGLPMTHIGEAYQALVTRMVKLILDAAPEAEPLHPVAARADAAFTLGE
jgi:hypothetical protein